MSSIFRKDDNYVDKPKRNTFDLSHTNNLTMKFGNLYPVLCQEVLPGDSFRIDPKFALRYMPQVFPVQTRQRASLKFFYVRNRNLWNDWTDFIGKTKQGLVSPYISLDPANYGYYLRPSGLLDYFGYPIKINAPYGDGRSFRLGKPILNGTDITYIPNGSTNVLSNLPDEEYNTILTYKNISKELKLVDSTGGRNYLLSDIYGGTSESLDILPRPSDYIGSASSNNVAFCLFRKPWVFSEFSSMIVSNNSAMSSCWLIVRTDSGKDIAVSPTTSTTLAKTFTLNEENLVTYIYHEDGSERTLIEKVNRVVGIMASYNDEEYHNISMNEPNVDVLTNANPDLCWCDVAFSSTPYNSSNADNDKFSALPLRAYVQIYNALIRNPENNPYILNGVPEYNKFLANTKGGSDTSLEILTMQRCNWADDRFTTALPSPQQGNAPLVGLTGVQGATVVLGNEDGTQSRVNLKVDSSTGNVMMVESVSDDSPEYLNDALMSAVEYGITINDLRNVNAFQRWLENNVRRGYKYKDQLMAHYGVNARYDVLDMPEFLGGMSRDVNVTQITQTTQNEDGNLGDYAGQSSIFGDGSAIEHYCDEHGFIIGIMCVYPMPIYQDSVPKYLLKRDAFDYYFPEFGKIGMQPIMNKELDYSQSFIAGKKDETFGYQRAWYDYLENLDSVHGKFRFDLRNFLIARDFAEMPKLNSSFLTMSADDVNNTFYTDDDEDKIIGQVHFNMSVKRCIPLVGIPSLE